MALLLKHEVLFSVMASIRWAGSPNTVTVEVDGLEVGIEYKLQLLFCT
eukprot:SAG31_NODE_13470_length_867_cov_0.805990_1_plen_47_part_10